MDGQLWELHSRIKDKNLGYKIGIQAAPERALNLKDIYVKMQACVL